MKHAGTVEQLGSKAVNTRFGSKNTYSAKVGGQWFKFGFKDPKLSVGDVVELDYNPGTYGNEVGTCTKTAAAPTPAPANDAAAAPARPAYTGGGKGSFPIGPLDGQRSIVRQNALTNARELVAAAIFDGKKSVNLDIDVHAAIIINLAKRFEAYTTGDMDMEEVLAEQEQKAA